MSYGDYLKAMLRPLGVYRLDGSINGAELEAWGAGLDRASGHLEETEREMLLTTAESFGLERIAGLLQLRPVSLMGAQGDALAALLRISGDSFTLAAVNDAIAGCGVPAKVEETDEAGVVQVTFPQVQGDELELAMDQIKAIIREIIPCHLEIRYFISNTTWGALEAAGFTWGQLSDGAHTWVGIALMNLG